MVLALKNSLAPCPTGEDTYVLCENCGFAANVEAMKTIVAPLDSTGTPEALVVDTPNTPTIDSLVSVLNERYGGGYTGADTLKNVLLVADGQNISVLVPGDREVDLKRLQANLLACRTYDSLKILTSRRTHHSLKVMSVLRTHRVSV